MTYPEELMYTKDHEWLRRRDSKARIGVSSYAVEQLGDVVHVDLPSVGTKVSEGEAFGTIESTKTVSDIYAPCNGTVIAVNERLFGRKQKRHFILGNRLLGHSLREHLVAFVVERNGIGFFFADHVQTE